MQRLLGCLTMDNVSKLYFESKRMVQLFQFVEKTCISTDCLQAACEIAYHKLSFAHKISSQTILLALDRCLLKTVACSLL